MNPLVSILIPCYNAEQWIEQAIDSALKQTYQNTEVIVVDDGSSDRSLEIIESYGRQISWLTQENQGGNVTRNRLLQLSKGSWLQYLDADDYLLPDKVAKQIEFLAQNPNTDIIYSPSIIQYHDTEVISKEVLSISQPHDPLILLARWYLPQTGSPLWRKEAVVSVGGWKANQPCCQEHELYLRLLQAGKKFNYCDFAGAIYRQWSELTVCKKDKTETYHRRLEITDKLEQHLVQTQQLTKLRQHQINRARFECARIIWLTDKQWANTIVARIHNTEQTFSPWGECAPQTYRLMYRWFGFEIAERIAAIKRRLTVSNASFVNS